MTSAVCAKCLELVSDTATVCRNCGAPQVSQRVSVAKKNRRWIWVSLGCFVGFVIFAIVTAPPVQDRASEQPSPPTLERSEQEVRAIGSIARVVVRSGVVVVAVDEAAYKRFATLAYANDTLGIADLVLQGQAFTVSSGTRVKVIDRGFERREVRIIEGESFGRSGWVTHTLVSE